MDSSSLGPILERVRDLFVDSFDKQSLRELLLFRLSQTLAHEVSEGDNFRTVVLNLLVKARREGWLLDLASKARETQPLRKQEWNGVVDALKTLGKPQIYKDALRDILSNVGMKDIELIFKKFLKINCSDLPNFNKKTKRTQVLIERLESDLLQSVFIGAVLEHLPHRDDLEKKYRNLAPKDINRANNDRQRNLDTNTNFSLSRPIKVSRYRKQEVFDAEAIANVAFSPVGDLMAFSLDSSLMLLPLNDPFPLPMPESTTQSRNDIARSRVNGADRAYSLPCTISLRITDISFSPDGKYVAASHNDGSIRFWSVAERRLFTEIRPHRDEVSAITFSSDGRYFASAGLDEIVNVWEFKRLTASTPDPWREFTRKSMTKKSRRYDYEIERYFSLSFSPRGEHLATGDQRGNIVVRDLQSGSEVFRKCLHNHTVNCMAFSPSPSSPGLLASCSDDTRILLTDFMKESKPTTLGILEDKHTKPVSSLSFSYKGDILASSGHDGSIRLWDVHTQRLLKIEEIEVQKTIQKVAFFPNKYDFATDCYTSDISLWNISNEGTITNTKVETVEPTVNLLTDMKELPMMPGVQFEEVWKALVAAFSKPAMERLLRFRMSAELFDVVADGPKEDVVFNLLSWTEQYGRTTELIRAAYAVNPSHPAVQAVYQKYGMATEVSVQHSEREGPGRPTVAVKGTGDGFEKTVRDRLPPFDFSVWRTKMTEVEGRVCRVEIGGNAAGTGFLVGPDAVLTNYHVLEAVLTGATVPGKVTCRFDYKVLADHSKVEGVVVGLHATGWHLDSCPYSPAEKTMQPDNPPPTADQLDYALVKLARPVGAEPFAPNGGAEAQKRGWLTLPAGSLAFVRNAPLVIAQYPDGSPLKLALDTESVIGEVAGGLRVRYRTNTDNGSSGSPVFDLDWNPVALHHLGDPASDLPATYNQGVPLDKVRTRVAKKPEALAALG